MNPDLAQLLQLTLNGVAIGAIYALVALGLVLTYKATEVLNFAHGDVLMASSFVGWGLIVGLGWPFWLATLTTVLLAAAFSWLLDARIMRLIVGQPQFAGVMLTIAIAFMLRGLVSMSFGPDSRTYPTPWTGQKTQIGTLVVNDLSLAIVGMALLITLVLFWFLKKTALGTSIQAASQNQLAAYLSGIRVKRVTSMVWAISGAIAAVCGLLLAPIALVDIGFDRGAQSPGCLGAGWLRQCAGRHPGRPAAGRDRAVFRGLPARRIQGCHGLHRAHWRADPVAARAAR